MPRSSIRPLKTRRLSWTKEDDELLLQILLEFKIGDAEGEEEYIEDYFARRDLSRRKTWSECEYRLMDIHKAGNYYATIDDVWGQASNHRVLQIREREWNSMKNKVYRSGPPNFVRRHLPGDNRREQNEFVQTKKGANLGNSVPLSGRRRSEDSTVNDELIPVDLFGNQRDAAQKAHLLPRAHIRALTWTYPACAVLGITTTDESIVEKAVLGCSTTNPPKKYPGVRNMVSNLVRMTSQALHFDTNPNVLIFPIYTLLQAKNWTGEGYEAIVLCSNGTVADSIKMTNVDIFGSPDASLSEINKAATLASEICKFLALSVLQKDDQDVDDYQSVGPMKNAHQTFRQEKKIAVPFPLLSYPLKPVCKIAFEGHTEGTNGHPAPDPMLLAFKSCNNWCQRFSRFRMVAVPEPEESDDELSEEGKQNLQDYWEWQAEQEKNLRHKEIMDQFGCKGKGVVDIFHRNDDDEDITL